MTVVPVIVKWNGKKFDVEMDTKEKGLVFKAQLYALTGVEPSRQKIMIKGGLIKDDTDLSKLNVKPGQTFMMMGTAGEIPKAPTQPIVFLEDLDDQALAKALELPTGLVNLGNTCYMNATLQCLRTVPELNDALVKMPISRGDGSVGRRLTNQLSKLFKDLNDAGESFSPNEFIDALRAAFPNFAQRGAGGIYAQQDAEECWSGIISTLRNHLPANNEQGRSNGKNVVDQYMTGEMTITLKRGDNEPVITKEPFTKLHCRISQTVNYLASGLKEDFTESIQSESGDTSNADVKILKISRLPSYLAINFVRFFWKTEENVAAKILRKVKFPLELDMYEFCTPELQEKMQPARAKFHEIQHEKALAESQAKIAAGNVPANSTNNASTSDTAMEVEPTTTVDKEALLKTVNSDLLADIGCSYLGIYDLCAVLTHIGRSVDSGHYIAWVRRENTDDWFKFDDDRVTVVKSEDILKLDGGGDWHTAYITLYRAKKFD